MQKDTRFSFSIFVLRVVLGVIFINHGAQKLFGMLDGIGIEGTTRMMEGLGFPYPHISALLWASTEFLGGLFLVFGFLTRCAASLISIIMMINILRVNLSYGFFVENGGFEYNLLILAACFPLIFVGGGGWSIWDV